MEIKLTKLQTETINILQEGRSAGANERMLRQIVNVGICFMSVPPSRRKMVMKLLEP